jgi:hypothetical protein
MYIRVVYPFVRHPTFGSKRGIKMGAPEPSLRKLFPIVGYPTVYPAASGDIP